MLELVVLREAAAEKPWLSVVRSQSAGAVPSDGELAGYKNNQADYRDVGEDPRRGRHLSGGNFDPGSTPDQLQIDAPDQPRIGPNSAAEQPGERQERPGPAPADPQWPRVSQRGLSVLGIVGGVSSAPSL